MTNIKKIIKEFEEKFFNEETDLRNWMLKQATQRPEQVEWIKMILRQVAEEAVKACKVERIDTEKNCKECEFDCIKEDLPACSNCNRGYGYNSALNNSQAKGRKWIEENL